MLGEYVLLRHNREEEKKRLRKKFGKQSNREQETVFSSIPTPGRLLTTKKIVAPAANGVTGRRLSQPNQNGSRSVDRDGKRDARPIAPVNYVAISKEDVPRTEHMPITP